MIEAKFENRCETICAMSRRPNDGESIDERVVDELRVTCVAASVPRHVVRFTNFLDHRAIVGAHPCSRIARHPGEVGDRSDSSARHRSRAGKIGMHYHVYKCAELQRRGIESGLYPGLSSVLDGPGEPFRIGA